MSKLYDLLSAMCGKIKKPDWNQNNPTAPDYVKNRPFYIHLETRELFPEQSVVFEDADGFLAAQIETTQFSGLAVGDVLSVKYDNELYDCNLMDMHGGFGFGNLDLALGTGDTGEPFAGMFSSEMIMLVVFEGNTHTFCISGQIAEKKLLAVEYLPEDVAIFTKRKKSTGMPEYIEWDGDKTDRPSVKYNGQTYYKISDLTPSLNEFVGQTLTVIYGDGTQGIRTFYSSQASSGDGYLLISLLCVFTKTGSMAIIDEGREYNISVQETGLYAIHTRVNGSGMQVTKINFNQEIVNTGIVIPSSDYCSNKKFFLTVDDSGTITATEVTG